MAQFEETEVAMSSDGFKIDAVKVQNTKTLSLDEEKLRSRGAGSLYSQLQLKADMEAEEQAEMEAARKKAAAPALDEDDADFLQIAERRRREAQLYALKEREADAAAFELARIGQVRRSKQRTLDDEEKDDPSLPNQTVAVRVRKAGSKRPRSPHSPKPIPSPTQSPAKKPNQQKTSPPESDLPAPVLETPSVPPEEAINALATYQSSDEDD